MDEKGIKKKERSNKGKELSFKKIQSKTKN